MEEGKIATGRKELHRWHLMRMAEVGKITLKEAIQRKHIEERAWIQVALQRIRRDHPKIGSPRMTELLEIRWERCWE
jgi:hypothetical protein